MDAIIKLGGSLAQDPERLEALCCKLSEYAKDYAITVVPGGGKFADIVREFDHRFNLTAAISHKMAIIGMDQFGLLLSKIMPNSCATYELNDVKQLSEIGAIPIFLPSRLMVKEDPLENSWAVTSDSIAAYLASRLRARKLVLVTDVDGVFDSDPKEEAAAELIERLSAKRLLELNMRTSVDLYLPKLLLKAQMNCYVVNGRYPDRIKAILAGHPATCTFIFARVR